MFNIWFILFLNRQLLCDLIILNNQIQEQSVYKILNEDHDFYIWIRFQTQYIQLLDIQEIIPFMVIKDHKSQVQITLSFQAFKNKINILSIEQNITNIFTIYNNISQWSYIYLNKQDQFEYSTLESQKIIFDKSSNYDKKSHYGIMCTWQNITFSLKAFKQELGLLNDQIMIKNNDIVKASKVLILNQRDLIQIQFYFRQPYLNLNNYFFIIEDETQQIEMYMLNNSVIIIDRLFKYNYEMLDVESEWNFVSIQFSNYDTTLNILTKDQNKIFRQKANNVIDSILLFGIEMYFFNNEIEIQNILVTNNKNQLLSNNFCYPNCQECNKNICFKCLNNLSLDNQCQCSQNQFYDEKLQFCQDISNNIILENEKNEKNEQDCLFGHYYNTYSKKCLNCPNIQQFQCLDCFYNTEKWYNNKICTFQEIQTINLMELYYQQQIIYSNFTNFIKFNHKYSKIIENKLLEFDQSNGQIYQIHQDVYNILNILCQRGYYLNKIISKCVQLPRGILSKSYFFIQCKLGYYKIFNKCIKCPKFCKICKYEYQNKSLNCLIPEKGYYISKNQIKFCPSECPFCLNSTYCTDMSIQKLIMKDNCLIEQDKLCLFCRPSYYLDYFNNCVNIFKVFNFFQFYFVVRQYHQELNYFQIKNLILQENIMLDQIKDSTKAFRAQFTALSYFIEQGLCLQKNETLNCEFNYRVKENYQYISSLNNTYYCPNNNCYYNLILNVTVYISNRQLIVYENKNFYNFHDLFNNIKKQQIYLKMIKVNADVYVFESINQECQDFHLFKLNPTYLQQYLNHTKFKITINFQQYSIFPECHEVLLINFDFIEINYFVTSSPIQIQIQSNYLKFYKCNFQKSNQIFLINSSEILFLNTTFMNKYLDQPMILFQNFTKINYLTFINCNFADIKLQNTNLIQSDTDLNNLLFQSTQIYDVFLYISSFIQLEQAIENIVINDMNIQILEMRNGLFFSDKASDSAKILYQLISIDKSFFQNSTFILQDQHTIIQDFEIKFIEIRDSNFIFINYDCVLNNITFQNINSEFTNLITLLSENVVQLYEILFLKNSFNESTSLISVTAEKLQLSNLIVKKCLYRPNFKIVVINSNDININDIQILNLLVFSYQNVLTSLYFIIIDGLKVLMQNITIDEISMNQIKILHVTYAFLQFQNFQLTSITYFQQLQGELIGIIQKSQLSTCHLSQFTIKNIIFTFYQQSFLFLFQGKQGISYCKNFTFYNISSFNGFYLFKITTQVIYIKNINLNEMDQIGLLQQNGSAIQIAYLNYNSILNAINKIYDFPIIFNMGIAQRACIIIIYHSIFVNQRQPLIFVKNSGLIQITLFNITIIDYYYKIDIMNIGQNYNYQSRIQLEYIQIKKAKCYGYLIQSANISFIIIKNIYIFNSQVSLLSSQNVQTIVINHINIINSQNQNFVNLINTNNHSVVQNMLFTNTTFVNIFQFDNPFKTTIVHNLYFKQTKSQSFFVINGTKQKQFIIRYLQIYVSIESNQLVKYIQNTKQSSKIHNIYVQDSNIFELFESYNLQLFIHKIYLINIEFQSNYSNNLIIYEDSYAYNCSYQDQQFKIQNKRLSFLNNNMDQNSPIFLSFHRKQKFQQTLIHSNILLVQFNNSNIMYLPTGIPINEYIKFNFKTQQQEQIYDYFAIVSNQPQDLSCQLNSSIDDQIGNYTNINQFIIKNQVNIIDNLTFYMNPYQKYSYIQNDIVCDNFDYILRFNVRILPCQLGEYFSQNKCKICDINKLQYSVNKIAYFCNIIDINKIEQAKRGQIKLKSGFWRPQIDNNFIEYCKSELCIGGWSVGDQSCVQGQVGALCKECDIYNIRGQGQYAQNENGCLLCDYNIQLLFKGSLVISWLMFLVYLSYDTNKQVIRQYLQFKISQRKLADILMRQSLNQISVIIKICTNYAFYLYLIKDNLDFLLYEVNLSVNILSNPTQLISPQLDCLLAQFNQLQLPYANLVFTLITPFYVLSLFYFIYLIMLSLKLAKFQFNVILITIYSVYLFNQQLILQSQIKLLSSIRISNIDWVYFNQQYKYNTKEHYHMVFYFILPTTIIFIFIPVIIYFQIKNKEKRSISVIKYYGTLYREYKLSTYYWEIIRIYQKFVTIIQLYLYNQQNQAYFIFLIQVYLIIMIQSQPYPLKNLNYLEQRSLVSLNWCLMIAFFMQESSNYLKATIFAIVNLSLLIDVIKNFIRKVKLQYRDQLNQINTVIVKKIPQTSKFINLQKSIVVQQNINKVRNSVIKIKSRMVSTRSIYVPNEIILNTNLFTNVKSEIEMVNINQQDQ